MKHITLIYPTLARKEDALAFRDEFFRHGETMIPGSTCLDKKDLDYELWVSKIIDSLHQDTCNPLFGTSETFFVLNEQERIVGITQFRHSVEDFYQNAGHIGYSIRPSERQKGYAHQMLKSVLQIAKNQNFPSVFVNCKKSNEASRRTILSCGGILSREFLKGEEIYEEYIIHL